MINITCRKSPKVVKKTTSLHAIQIIVTGILPGLLLILNCDCIQAYITPFCVTFDCSICCVCKQYHPRCSTEIRIYKAPFCWHFSELGNNNSFWEDTSIMTILYMFDCPDCKKILKILKGNYRFYRKNYVLCIIYIMLDLA